MCDTMEPTEAKLVTKPKTRTSKRASMPDVRRKTRSRENPAIMVKQRSLIAKLKAQAEGSASEDSEASEAQADAKEPREKAPKRKRDPVSPPRDEPKKPKVDNDQAVSTKLFR